MASKVFHSIVEADEYFKVAIGIAVNNACSRLLGKLQEFIMTEFYEAYDPKRPKLRTMQFYDSAITKMLTDCAGCVMMDASLMHYEFSGYGWSWDGEQQLEAANVGSHGGWTTEESEKHRYWDVFMDWCDRNAVKVLREELAIQGIKTI